MRPFLNVGSQVTRFITKRRAVVLGVTVALIVVAIATAWLPSGAGLPRYLQGR
jgi:hypothetical protein